MEHFMIWYWLEAFAGAFAVILIFLGGCLLCMIVMLKGNDHDSKDAPPFVPGWHKWSE